MNSEELCKMCTEYGADKECEHFKNCKLQYILSENKLLKIQVDALEYNNKFLETENKKLKAEIGWMKYPEGMGR